MDIYEVRSGFDGSLIKTGFPSWEAAAKWAFHNNDIYPDTFITIKYEE